MSIFKNLLWKVICLTKYDFVSTYTVFCEIHITSNFYPYLYSKISHHRKCHFKWLDMRNIVLSHEGRGGDARLNVCITNFFCEHFNFRKLVLKFTITKTFLYWELISCWICFAHCFDMFYSWWNRNCIYGNVSPNPCLCSKLYSAAYFNAYPV